MAWSTRFRLRQYLKGSLWFTPLLGCLAGPLLANLVIEIDRSVSLPPIWSYSAATASTVLTTIVGAMVALTGFVITVTVLVVQMATSTYSARYMRLWYRDRLLKALLTALVGALTFSFALLRRIESDFVPDLGVTCAGTLVVLALLLFLIFLDRCIHLLRPVAIAALVADAGNRAFRDLSSSPDAAAPPGVREGEPAFVVRAHGRGVIQAIDEQGLVRWARDRDSVLRFRRTVGDSVVTGAPVIEVFGPAGDAERGRAELGGKVALGIERTIEQDPAFALRILVDIAEKALSAAVNDPTTAVQVMNHLAEMLRVIGSTDLATHACFFDEEGRPRVLLPSRRWEDYLALAVTEIREYGATSIQVVRRLRAMLDDLLADVRPEHRRAVEDELARLDLTVAAAFGDSTDLDRASIPDRQGIGGPTVPAPATAGPAAA
jgi:uncharacterized membrane protein